MSPENEVLQIPSYCRARLNQTGSKFGFKLVELGWGGVGGVGPDGVGLEPVGWGWGGARALGWVGWGGECIPLGGRAPGTML